MIFKERGLTVGDLLLIVIFIISTVFIINKFRDGNRQTYNYMSPNEITNSIKNNYSAKEKSISLQLRNL